MIFPAGGQSQYFAHHQLSYLQQSQLLLSMNPRAIQLLLLAGANLLLPALAQSLDTVPPTLPPFDTSVGYVEM